MPRTAPLLLLLLASGCDRQPRTQPGTGQSASPPNTTRSAALAEPSASAARISEPPHAGELGERCGVEGASWRLRLDPRGKLSVAELSTLLGRAAADVRCGEHGQVFVELSTAQTRELFGQHVSLSRVAGAGNSMDTCGSFASIEPPSFVPQKLTQRVRRVQFETDEKFEFRSDVHDCPAPLP